MSSNYPIIPLNQLKHIFKYHPKTRASSSWRKLALYLFIALVFPMCGKKTVAPQVKNGIMDVSAWNFRENGLINLEGQWRYFPSKFIHPSYPVAKQSSYLSHIPSEWTNYGEGEFKHIPKQPHYGYGSYAMVLKNLQTSGGPLSLQYPEAATSYRLYLIELSDADLKAGVFLGPKKFKKMLKKAKKKAAKDALAAAKLKAKNNSKSNSATNNQNYNKSNNKNKAKTTVSLDSLTEMPYGSSANGAFDLSDNIPVYMQNGRPQVREDLTIPQLLPIDKPIPETIKHALLVIHIANYHHRQSGFWAPMKLDLTTSFERNKDYNDAMTFVSLGIILVMGLYHLGLFSQRREDKGSLLFGIFCLSIVLRILTTERIFHNAYSVPSVFTYEFIYKLEYLSFYLAPPLFFQFLLSVFPAAFLAIKGKLIDILGWCYFGVFAASVIFFPAKIYSSFITYFYLYVLLIGFVIIVGLSIAWHKRLSGSLASLIGFLFFFATVINDQLHAANVIYTAYITQYGLIAFIFSQSLILSTQFSVAFRESEQLRVSLARFVPTQFLNILDKDSITQIQVGDAVLKNMTVLFTDIRNFTTLSENLSIEANFNFLNDFLGRMAPAIQANNGFVDKFIGDSIMALFQHSSNNAIHAAITMRKELTGFNEFLGRKEIPLIDTGIGINSGDMMLGTVGSFARLNTTVIGNTVNLAARLETLTKFYQVGIIISEFVYHSMGKDHGFHCREIGAVRVKGKNQPVEIFEIYDAEDKLTIQRKQDCMPYFEKALVYYKLGEFEDARSAFKKSLAAFPDDRVAQVYLKRCHDLIQHPPEKAWDGIDDFNVLSVSG